MATVIGLMETAKGYLPNLGALRRRARPEPVAAAPVFADANPAVVAGLIANQVIPRLLVAHRHDPSAAHATGGDHVSMDEALDFAPLALELEADVLLDHVEAFVARGVSIDAIFVELLAPAARRLGELWEDDLCDFVDVTMGLWRLQEMVRALSARAPERFGGADSPRRALFSVMPGDQHSFGTVIVEDVFARNGWGTDLVQDCTTGDLLDRVARTGYDLVGLTVNADAHIGRLQSLVLALRSVSRNPRVCIMLGGQVLVTNPEIVHETGADGTAPDALQALETAGRLVAALAPREVFNA